MKTWDLKTYWREWLMLLLGAWMIVSPYVLGFADSAAVMWSAVISGLILMALALAEISKLQVWEEWGSLMVGIWMVVAPFVLGFTTMSSAMWNSFIVGVLVVAAAAWTLMSMTGQGRGGRPA
ncbi:MAG: SPW repeat protein [Halomonas sp.]|nr:SPW repeat protein [Halomonas sp.]